MAARSRTLRPRDGPSARPRTPGRAGAGRRAGRGGAESSRLRVVHPRRSLEEDWPARRTGSLTTKDPIRPEPPQRFAALSSPGFFGSVTARSFFHIGVRQERILPPTRALRRPGCSRRVDDDLRDPRRVQQAPRGQQVGPRAAGRSGAGHPTPPPSGWPPEPTGVQSCGPEPEQGSPLASAPCVLRAAWRPIVPARLGVLPGAAGGAAGGAAVGRLCWAPLWGAWRRRASSPYLFVDTPRRGSLPGLSSLGLGATRGFDPILAQALSSAVGPRRSRSRPGAQPR
jgi:hypothetical protein